MDMELVLGGIAIAVNRFVETFIKPAVSSLDLTETARKWVLLIVSLAIGVVAVLGASTELNLFVMFFPGIVGQILTGLVVGGGANFLNEVLQLLKSLRGESPTVTVTAPLNQGGTLAQSGEPRVGYAQVEYTVESTEVK